MTWDDKVTFVLKNDFALQSLQYSDSIIEKDSEDKSFKADFLIMSGVVTQIFQELLKVFAKATDNKKSQRNMEKWGGQKSAKKQVF